MQYYVNFEGKSKGPFNMAQLQKMVKRGEVTANHYLWAKGMPNWVMASEVSGLFSPSIDTQKSSSARTLLIVLSGVGGLLVLGTIVLVVGWWSWLSNIWGGAADDLHAVGYEIERAEEWEESEVTDGSHYEQEQYIIEESESAETKPPEIEGAGKEANPTGGKYDYVEEGLYYYIYDLLKHGDFNLIANDKFSQYSLDEFEDTYRNNLTYVYRFEKVGDDIEVNLTDQYGNRMFGLIMKWDGEEWMGSKYLD